LRSLDTMALVKLNVFHWHITDSQSFPIEIKSQPQLTELGAFSKDQVYTHEDVKEIVEYAKARGIRVIPELDSPAHIGKPLVAKDSFINYVIRCF
jgi:hexosaminidase